MIFDKEDKAALLKTSRIGAWKYEIKDGTPCALYADNTMLELMGAPSDLAPLELLKFFCSRVLPEDYELVREYIYTLSDVHTEVVYRYNHPELGIRLVRCSGAKSRSKGKKTILVGFHQDITDSLRLQYHQDKADRTLSQLTQRLYSYNLTIDPETGDYTLITGTGLPRIVEILQRYTNINTAHRELDAIICPGFRTKFYDLINFQKLKTSSVKGFVGNIEYPVVYPGSTKYEWHEVNVFLESDENEKRVINILARDITAIHEQQEQIAREVKLSASKDQMLSEITKMLYGYNVTLNLKTGKYTLIEGNGMPEVLQLLKRMDDYNTVFKICMELISPEYKEAYSMLTSLNALRMRQSRAGYIDSLEFSAMVNGSLKWYEINVFIGTDERGAPVANLLGRNVSEAHEKADTKAQLEIANKASAAKTSFLFNMSHDIRTPMNAIMGFTDLLDKNQKNADKRKDYIRKIRESSTVLLSIINNVLEMARIENGSVALNEVPCDLNEFHESLRSVFSDMMLSKNIEFVCKNKLKTQYVFCDLIKVREVFINILSNAYKYTMEGGKVYVTIEEKPIEKDGYTIIRTTVSDTGIGMSEEFLPHIFEEFSREYTYTQNKIEGTGLGMPIVKKLLDVMGGTIEVQSQLGKGSTFIVSIPHKIAPKPHESVLENALVKTETLKNKRILLAEDNDLNAEIALSILEEEGLLVDRVEDGDVCVEKFENSPVGFYDMILMDIQMPRMNGYEATKKIRGLIDKAKAGIPIIAMTANAFEEDKREALNVGMNGHVAKPINVEKLMEAMVSLL